MSELTDGLGRPLRLYQKDGRPVTDRNGEPLRNICGNQLVTLEERMGSSLYCDMKGTPLTDSKGRTQMDAGFSPHEGPPEVDGRRCPEPVFALDGLPLTDKLGLPLLSAAGRPLVVFNPRGRPVTDLEGCDITDYKGVVLNPSERPYLKEKQPMRIFDELGRPLTDEKGFPLTDILGFPLIVNDEYRNPVSTRRGYPLKDAHGLAPWEEGYDLTKIPRYNLIHKSIVCKNKKNGIAFDQYGHPLTDMHGFPLFNIYGIPLVKKSKKTWVDSNKEKAIIIRKSLYDKDELRYLKNTKGTPVRLFDKRGYPLTDHDGMPLVHAQGVILIEFNESGEPISDSRGFPVYDCKGNPLGSPNFSPCRDFLCSSSREQQGLFKKTGAQYYDVHGMPVTNVEGIPLINAYQELMVKCDENFVMYQDIYGRNIYDVLGLPIIRSLDRPLKGPTGQPIRLYNKLGKPLTDKDGFILRSVKSGHSLSISPMGRIECDSRGFPIFDAGGCPMVLSNRFVPTKEPPDDFYIKALRHLDGSPLIMYDMTGEPLTDTTGRILFDNAGDALINISPSGLIQERNGDVILDTDGYTNFKISGRAVREKMSIYDKHDRPLIGPSGFILRLRSGKEIVRFDRWGYPTKTVDGGEVYDSKGVPIFTPLSDMFLEKRREQVVVFRGEVQLFDCEDRPLLDITGELLFSSRGVPLLNLNPDGTVRSDALGRPVFDSCGLPVCNPGGVWRDQTGKPYRLYDSGCFPVTDARGKELLNINGSPLIVPDTYGRPMYNTDGEVLSDAEGRKVTSSQFLGSAEPPHRRISSLMESKEVSLRLFDFSGRPLTDDCGMPLETSKGEPIFDLTQGLHRIRDLKGRQVYDYRGLPLGCSESTPILTASGEPIILYNKDGNPLMTREGLPIRRVDGSTLLNFDQFGRPMLDTGLFDLHGKPVGSADCVLTGPLSSSSSSPLMSLEGRPLKVFDRQGLPLTDDKGNVLYKATGEPLKGWGDNLC